MMNAHLFDKKGSPCLSQWALKQTLVLERCCSFILKIISMCLFWKKSNRYNAQNLNIFIITHGVFILQSLCQKSIYFKELSNIVLSPRLADIDLHEVLIEQVLRFFWNLIKVVLLTKQYVKWYPQHQMCNNKFYQQHI